MKYLLDTNAVSALMKGDARVVRNLSRVARADVSLPQPVIAETAYGIQRLPRSRRRDGLQARFDLVRGELPRASWSDEVSASFAVIKASLERTGKRIEDFDKEIQIAETGTVLSVGDGVSKIYGLQNAMAGEMLVMKSISFFHRTIRRT